MAGNTTFSRKQSASNVLSEKKKNLKFENPIPPDGTANRLREMIFLPSIC